MVIQFTDEETKAQRASGVPSWAAPSSSTPTTGSSHWPHLLGQGRHSQSTTSEARGDSPRGDSLQGQRAHSHTEHSLKLSQRLQPEEQRGPALLCVEEAGQAGASPAGVGGGCLWGWPRPGPAGAQEGLLGTA
ncbi:hypothetical protein H1C71_011569 [Ictidomys tridecemlineatus]|nr:hypothetical protein H1C71_011569 [Ictidomys tridecemlineatus]